MLLENLEMSEGTRDYTSFTLLSSDVRGNARTENDKARKRALGVSTVGNIENHSPIHDGIASTGGGIFVVGNHQQVASPEPLRPPSPAAQLRASDPSRPAFSGTASDGSRM